MNYKKIFAAIAAILLIFPAGFFIVQKNILKNQSIDNTVLKATAPEKYETNVEVKTIDVPKTTVSEKSNGSKEIINQIPSNQKIIALTFDADMTRGMEKELKSGKIKSWYNESVIKELEETQTSATLFLTGLWIKNYPAVTEELAKNPLFEIANHSYSHTAFASPCYSLPVISNNLDDEEIIQTEKLLEEYAPNYKKYFRFPGLCSDNFDIGEVQKLGYKIIGGNIIGGDGFNKDTGSISRRVISRLAPGGIIILHMHGAPNAPETGKALPEIIKQAKEKGYKFVKISELLKN